MYREDEKKWLKSRPGTMKSELVKQAQFDSSSSLSKARYLLSLGVDVDCTCGTTGLDRAVENCNPEMVRLFVSNGAKLEDSLFFRAVENCVQAPAGVKDAIVKILVNAGANLGFHDSGFGGTVLHLAAQNGRADLVRLFVSSGANINEEDKDGNTALHNAACSGREDIVVFLVNAGARTNCKNNAGKTPLDLAVEKHHEGVETFLRRAFPCSTPAPKPKKQAKPAAKAKTSVSSSSEAKTPAKTPAKQEAGIGSWSVTDPYKALCGYTGTSPGELSFKEGDVIFVQKKDGSNWEGVLNGKRGVFPNHYVVKL